MEDVMADGADTGTERKDVQGEPTVEVEKVVAPKSVRPRNYSFLHKKATKFDSVEVDGIAHPIPANVGSTYWAILKVAYEHANKPIYQDKLPDMVDELMSDPDARDPAAWDVYKNKGQTTVFMKGENKRVVKAAKPWQDRVINNAKTLTRLGGNSQYGKRLFERGHVLRYEYDEKFQPYFILRTNLDCLKKQDEEKTNE